MDMSLKKEFKIEERRIVNMNLSCEGKETGKLGTTVAWSRTLKNTIAHKVTRIEALFVNKAR